VAREGDYVVVGSEKMRQARKRLGNMSYEEVAVRMRRNGYKLSGQTYGRWEKAGQAKREGLSALAAVLGLDVGQILADQPSRVPWQRVEDVLLEIQETQKVLVSLLAEQRSVVGELTQIAVQLDRVGAAIARREAASS
jgi:hypothetical protein